jgi:hypothetical protein
VLRAHTHGLPTFACQILLLPNAQAEEAFGVHGTGAPVAELQKEYNANVTTCTMLPVWPCTAWRWRMWHRTTMRNAAKSGIHCTVESGGECGNEQLRDRHSTKARTTSHTDACTGGCQS